jgi:hypothetical protein
VLNRFAYILANKILVASKAVMVISPVRVKLDRTGQQDWVGVREG